jgi:hypothetical protein
LQLLTKDSAARRRYLKGEMCGMNYENISPEVVSHPAALLLSYFSHRESFLPAS